MKKILILLAFALGVLAGFSSCSRKGPHCPAYNSVHTDKNYAYNPNNQTRAKEDNKKDIEKRKEAELNPKRKKYKKPHSLFPPGMR